MVTINSPVFVAMRSTGVLAVLFWVIVLGLFVMPVSAETLIDTDTYTEIYGNTDPDYDYSVRYDFNFDEVVTDWSNETGFTNVHIISDQSYHSRTYYQAKPTILYIDFAEYSGLYSLSSTVLHVPPNEEFGFSTGFVLTSSEGYTVGGGDVHVWGTENNILQYYHSFSDMWNYSYTSTHQDTPVSLIITYDDTSQFDLIADTQTPYISNPNGVFANKTLRDIDLGLQAPVDVYTNWNGGNWFYDNLNTFIRADEKYTTVFDFVQSVEYKYNTGAEFGFVSLDRTVGLHDASGSRFGLSFNITDLDNNETDNHYFSFTDYEITDINSTVGRTNGLMFDLYSNPSLDFPTFTYIVDYGNDSFVYPDVFFTHSVSTNLDEYSPGDTVTVTYSSDEICGIKVIKTISGDIYHSIGFVSGATNATWDFYIAENEPYGFYDVYLLDSSNSILDSVRYSLLPTTSSLDILQSSVDLHETFVVFAQTVNESILSIEDPDGVEVWNESISALMYDYIYYTPTIKTGIYTAYLYDDATLNDTVMVYLADPPIIDDPLDPETNGTIPIEDVLEDGETMTEYFDDKFREFAPTAWGIFLLSILLWLMAILTSFGGSSKRR